MIKKSFVIITCLVITFLLTVVPCFANSVSPSDDTPTYSNYMGVDWTGISLDKSSTNSSYYDTLDTFQSFTANAIDSLTYTNSPYIIVDSPSTPNDYNNKTRIYANSVYNEFNDVTFKGAYHSSGTARSFENTSVLKTFSINPIRQWTFHETIDLYNDILYFNCVLPYGVLDDIITGNADNYLTLTFNYTVDILSSYNRGWSTVTDSVSYGLGGQSLNSILVNSPLWTNSLINVQGAIPYGFEVVTFFIPYTNILDDYKQTYITNGNVYLNYESVFTRNFNVTPSCEFKTSYLYAMLNGVIDTANAKTDDCNLYSSLVNTYIMDGYSIALSDRQYNTLPILSSFSTDFNDYSFDLDIYDGIMKGMGFDNVYVDGDVTGWLGEVLSNLFNVRLFGTISLGGILSVVLGVGLVMMIIKFFAGG